MAISSYFLPINGVFCTLMTFSRNEKRDILHVDDIFKCTVIGRY